MSPPFPFSSTSSPFPSTTSNDPTSPILLSPTTSLTIPSPRPLNRHRAHLRKYNHFRSPLISPGALGQPHHVLPTNFNTPSLLPAECDVRVWGKRDLFVEAGRDMYPRRGRRTNTGEGRRKLIHPQISHHADIDKLHKRGKTAKYDARRARGRERRWSLKRQREGEGFLDAANSSGSEWEGEQEEGEDGEDYEGEEGTCGNIVADDESGSMGVGFQGVVDYAVESSGKPGCRGDEDDEWLLVSEDEDANPEKEEDFVVVKRTLD